MELWGGFECTLNRVADRFCEQLLPQERAARAQCLRMLPALGVKSFRYRIAWDDLDTEGDHIAADIAALAQGSVNPIIGLLHHGSGPVGTDLLSPEFAQGLAAHAHRVVRRFPEVDMWTPVNEPLTTARFAALYGHWYPHVRSEHLFWLALLNQIDATRAAMHAIRRVNPHARLVQTEDLGRTFGTAALQDQVAYDNERRWMTWDLLCGRITQDHPFHARLCSFGYGDRLRAIADDPCPPDIVGVDHYLTSDRFLDHRLARYPSHSHGGNEQRAFADVEAVRVLSTPRQSITAALKEAWERYRIPVAMTECHNGCTREEQMRWFREAWQAAETLVAEGCDIRAVGCWAMLGARNWSSLATEIREDFECGAFDPRGDRLRATGLAHVIKSLSHGQPVPPAAHGDGWWRRKDRTHYRPAAHAGPVPVAMSRDHVGPLLIAGSTGTLGQALLRAARARGIYAVATSRDRLDLELDVAVASAIAHYKPWAVINATGWVRVDDAEDDPAGCARSNVDAAIALASECDRQNLPHVHFSSDLVFDGKADRMYVENDMAAALGVYGRTKAEADRRLLEFETSTIVRTAAFFSPFDLHNFAVAVCAALGAGRVFKASATHRVSPTYVPHLANFVLDLLIDGATGVWHASNGVELSWYEFARQIAEACGLDPDLVEPDLPAELGWIATRPARSGLMSQKGQMLPPLHEAIAEFAHSL